MHLSVFCICFYWLKPLKQTASQYFDLEFSYQYSYSIFGEIITHLFFGFIHIEEEALINFATWPYNIVPIAKNRILKSYEGNH